LTSTTAIQNRSPGAARKGPGNRSSTFSPPRTVAAASVNRWPDGGVTPGGVSGGASAGAATENAAARTGLNDLAG
jgi:hypothetical protein